MNKFLSLSLSLSLVLLFSFLFIYIDKGYSEECPKYRENREGSCER